MKSLRKSLTLSLTSILLVVFAFIWLAISFAMSKVAQDQLLQHLEHDGDALIEGLSIDDAGRLRLAETGVEDVYREAHSGQYFVIQGGAKDSILSPSLAGARLAVAALPSGRHASMNIPGPGGQDLLVLVRGIRLGDRTVQVAVAEDLRDLNREVRDQSLFVLLFIVPIFCAAVLMQRYIIGRALAPLASAADELQRLGRGEIDQLQVRLPGEVQPLVDEVNRLLLLVNRRLAQSRTAIGNLAHALKTPLAMLFRLADEPSLSRDARQLLQEQSDAIHGRLERELKRARLAGDQRAGKGIALRRELEDLAKVLQGIYRDKMLEIQILSPDGILPYDREDLLELVGNLADNACKWARHKVRIEIVEIASGTGLRIRIADDGPGCSSADRDRLMQRGTRLDESKPGHGLGLAICREIVDFYGGEMRIEQDTVLGGLAVVVMLGYSAKSSMSMA